MLHKIQEAALVYGKQPRKGIFFDFGVDKIGTLYYPEIGFPTYLAIFNDEYENFQNMANALDWLTERASNATY